jgi:hypothetical protein
METHALLFYSRTMDWIKREEASRRLDSDCRTDTNCYGSHDFFRTPFWAFKYVLESLSNILSKESRITSISIQSQPQSSIYYRVLFSPRCCVSLFWPNGPCIKLSPFWTCPRFGIRPQHPCGHSPTSLKPLAATKNTRVLLDVSLAFTTSL